MEEEGEVVEPLLWSITGFDEKKEANVLRWCRFLERVFGELALDGGRLSAEDRRRAEERRRRSAGTDDAPLFTSLAYGEVLFEPFAELMLHRALPHWQRWRDSATEHDRTEHVGAWRTFVDLGSGMGKAVWIARLVCGFTKRVVGIELLTPLHEGAVAARMRAQQSDELQPYQSHLIPSIAWVSRLVGDSHASLCRDDINGLELINGDFLKEDWSYADVAFCCCVTFEEELMQQIAKRATLLRPGSLFLTVGQPLPPAVASGAFRVVEKVACDFSWASCPVFIHQRH